MQHSKDVKQFLRFLLADGIGAKTLKAIIDYFGDIAKAAQANKKDFMKIAGVGPKKFEAIMNVSPAIIEQEIQRAANAGVKIVTLNDDRYPAALKTIYDPPGVLYIKGDLEPEDALAVGIVGSRKCTHYGSEQADRFGALLGRSGFTVISGGARGIDTAAHRGALQSGGRTIVVAGCGLDYNYPPENVELFSEILNRKQGCLISELPMQIPAKVGNFPNRNRIISGMSLGILLVEATVPSGALITASNAIEQGREVFAIPGRVDSPFSKGTNKLIREQSAALVSEFQDILDGLDEVGRKMAPEPEEAKPAEPVAVQNLAPLETEIYELLGGRTLSLDEVVRKIEKPVSDVVSAMTMLAIRSLIEQQPGNIFTRRKR